MKFVGSSIIRGTNRIQEATTGYHISDSAKRHYKIQLGFYCYALLTNGNIRGFLNLKDMRSNRKFKLQIPNSVIRQLVRDGVLDITEV